MSPDKSLPIIKAMVWKAYQLVNRNWSGRSGWSEYG